MPIRRFCFILFLLSVCGSCRQPDEIVVPVPVEHVQTLANIELPLGLPEFVVPDRNSMTKEKIALGKKLFFDKNLSLDRTVSCASCHDPEKHWGNGLALGTGVEGHVGTRNVPTLINVAYFRQFFWDGRAGSLESQALLPMLNEKEMAMPSREAIFERLEENPEYYELFGKAFADGVTVNNLAKALACFERTILSGNTPYDRYIAGDQDAMSDAAIRGLRVFKGPARCVNCHVPPTFIDHSFYNLGVGMDKDKPDLGRYHVFQMESARGKFKTPTMRDIAKTGPYMHDGSIETLEEIVELYDQGGIRNRYLSNEVRRPLRLSEQDKKDLVTFMVEGLTSNDESNTEAK